MATVLVPLAQGFEEIEAVAIIDVLRRAQIEVVSVYLHTQEVTGANGITLLAQSSIDDISASGFDMIVLPGGALGAECLRDDERVQKLLKEFDAQDKHIAAICAAPIALEKAGVLKDEFTCYPSYETQIGSSRFSEQRVVHSANILTSRSPGTALCFALEIVKILTDDHRYKELKDALLAKC